MGTGKAEHGYRGIKTRGSGNQDTGTGKAEHGYRGIKTRGLGKQDTGTGKAEHGYREGKTRRSGYVSNEMTECMNVSSYKGLKVWHKGIEIVDHVYEVTS